MKKYAYLDKGGILHVSASKKTAQEYSANHQVVETEHPADHGYPVHNGEEVIMYAEDEAYIHGNVGDGKRLNLEKAPELVALYRACK